MCAFMQQTPYGYPFLWKHVLRLLCINTELDIVSGIFLHCLVVQRNKFAIRTHALDFSRNKRNVFQLQTTR